jgi:hypothetical protein
MKQIIIGVAALALAACAGGATTTTLTPADAATSLIVGERLSMSIASTNASNGQDALVTLTLTHADGRAMAFQEANHAPYDLVVQAADGALAQVMGLSSGEVPTLYRSSDDSAPFLCPPDGPVALGLHRGANGNVTIVGLEQNFQVETRADGTDEALPFSPDMVCARLKLRS